MFLIIILIFNSLFCYQTPLKQKYKTYDITRPVRKAVVTNYKKRFTQERVLHQVYVGKLKIVGDITIIAFKEKE